MTTTTNAAETLPMLTINDIRRELNCSRNTAYARTREEGFPLPYVFGGSYRWPADEFEAWKQKQRATTRDILPEAPAQRPSMKPTKTTVTKEAPLPAPKPVAKRKLLEAAA